MISAQFPQLQQQPSDTQERPELLQNVDLKIKKIDSSANSCTVQRAGSDTIDGATSVSLTKQYANVRLHGLSGTSTWDILSVHQLGGDLSGISSNATVSQVNGAAVPTSATVVGTNSSSQIISATVQGNGTKVQLSTGSTTTNDCVKYDANGNAIDSGLACGAGVATPSCALIGSSDTISAAGTFATTCAPTLTLSAGSVIEIRAHGVYTTTSTSSPLAQFQVNAGVLGRPPARRA